LDAISQSTPSDIEVQVEKSECNIFYIPAIKAYNVFYFPINNYNSTLALDYITRLGRMIKVKPRLVWRFTLRPGPFVISTFNPLGEVTGGEINLLYADLSDSNPAAMRETVSAYKKRVGEEELIGVQKFNSIRLALLNLILYVDDNLQIVRAEASDWLGEDR
jgi:hypothetical protein